MRREREARGQLFFFGREEDGQKAGKRFVPALICAAGVGNGIVVEFRHFADDRTGGKAVPGAAGIYADVDQKFLGIVCIEVVVIIAADHVTGKAAGGGKNGVFFRLKITGDQNRVHMFHFRDRKAEVVSVCMDV